MPISNGSNVRRTLVGALALIAAAVLAACGSSAALVRSSARTALRFRVFLHTSQKLDSIIWTGRQFLYVQNTANTIWAAPRAGHPLHRFAQMPKLVEETRCVLSPGRHGFPSGAIFCHSPDNKIYEISADGSRKTVFATLPVHTPPSADGALAFDTVGHFGSRLVAATGRSGGVMPAGGVVFTVSSRGRVQRIGSYAGPGGADELIIARRGFGSVGGDALLTVDAGKAGGRLVAMDSNGRTRSIATMSRGLSPIAAIPTHPSGTRAKGPAPGFYLTDDKTANTFFAPAADLARYSGDVLVGTESPTAHFWIVAPRGKAFAATPLQNNLAAGTSLEQGIFIG
jgi:hypothetical protein